MYQLSLWVVFLGLAFSSLGSAQERVPDVVLRAEDTQNGTFFGDSVAVVDGWLFSGTYAYPNPAGGIGRVQAYRLQNGAFEFHSAILSPMPFPDERFTLLGIATTEHHLAVTSPFYSGTYPNGFPSGRVYVFEEGAQGWESNSILVQNPNLPFPVKEYGSHVVASDNHIFVGAPISGPILPNGIQTAFGVVHIYDYVGGQWVESQIWSPPFTPDFSGFAAGSSMGADDQTLALGKNWFNRLVILEKDATGTWVMTQVMDDIAIINDESEWAIAVDGNTMVIGVEHTLAPIPGVVYVFRKIGGVWSAVGEVESPDYPTSGNRFGEALDLRGSRLLVGDRAAPPGPGGGLNPGAAYLFEMDDQGTFQFQYKFVASDPNLALDLGDEVALGPDFALVGDRHATNGPGEEVGAAYRYDFPLGSMTCAGVTNSTGQAASLEILGSRRAEQGFLRLRVGSLPAGQAGMFLAAPSSGFVANAGGSLGNLCLGGAVTRFNRPDEYGMPDGDGRFEMVVDIHGLGPNPFPILSGETWNFQCWYRDWNLGRATNFSNGVEVLFL